MEQGGRMLKKLVSNLLKNTMPAQSDKKHLESVELVWNKNNSMFEFFVDWEKYDDHDILWHNIQRDVILSLAENSFVVVHLLSSQAAKYMDEYGEYIEALDEEIGRLYPYQRNEKGEYFIEIMPNDRRLLTKIQNDYQLWECGHLLHIAIFSEKQDTLSEAILNNAELVIQSFYDNIGFDIKIQNSNLDVTRFKEKISRIVGEYHIAINHN